VKPQWLERSLIVGPYFTLCLSEVAFRDVASKLKWRDPGPWIRTTQADATAHHAFNEDGEPCTIVCVRGFEGRDPVSVAGLLIHEAVHIWQRWCDDKGEDSPGHETEAYAVQWLSQQLMWEFVRQTGGAK
jgi:hypothetical protein